MPIIKLFKIINFITHHPLNRDHKVGAIVRFLKWQISSRLAPGAIVFDWVNSSRFLVRTGEAGLTGNIYTGLHEFPDMGFLLHFLRPEDLFVDVGANVGSYTLLACAAIGARGIAFEPVPGTYQRLSENMRLNNLDDTVQYINKGIGNRAGALDFTSEQNATNHALAANEKCDNTVTVEVTTLDVALQNECPTLIKIDVEGYETAVLEGAHAILKNPKLRAVIMELNGSGTRYGYDETNILDLMKNHGFRTYSYDPLRRHLISLDGKNLDSGNTLFIRDKPFVEDRIISAAMVSVHNKKF